MKILMATMGLDIGGAETHIVELSKELKSRGHQVAVVSNGGVYVPEIEAAGIRHYAAPLNRRSVGSMLQAQRILRQVIAREKPDIVHAHARIPAFLCGRLQKSMGFAFVTSCHGVYQVSGALRLLSNWGERTLAVSEDIRDYLVRQYNVPQEHITLTINGIDTDKFSPALTGEAVRREFDLGDGPVIAHVSRLDPETVYTARQLVELSTCAESVRAMTACSSTTRRSSPVSRRYSRSCLSRRRRCRTATRRRRNSTSHRRRRICKGGSFLATIAPYIPESITVHLGSPDSNAENVTVSFSDYVKNVLSSEVYPTWEPAALRANALAIISFALNRIYTEYYRSRGYSFDITSSTAIDQKFINGRNIYENISELVDELFTDYLRKQGFVEPLAAKFCNGVTVTCQGLSQWGSQYLAQDGANSIDILRTYYGEDVELVTNAPVQNLQESYPGSPVRRGDIGVNVSFLQVALNRISQNYPAIPKVPVDAIFGEATENAVRAFQLQHPAAAKCSISHQQQIAAEKQGGNPHQPC